MRAQRVLLDDLAMEAAAMLGSSEVKACAERCVLRHRAYLRGAFVGLCQHMCDSASGLE